jgi:hypothetical protein
VHQMAVWYINQYYVVDRERLHQLCSARDPHNALVYECRVVDSLSPENVVKTTPLVKLGAMGLPLNYAYADAGSLQRAARGTHKLYEIVETPRTVASVVSRQILKHQVNMVSGSHCQDGQGGKIYQLKRIRTSATPLTLPDERRVGNKRSSRKGGGRRGRSVRRTQRPKMV